MKKSKAEHVPLLNNKYYNRPSIFIPENLLRETRRQKSLPIGKVPPLCILDPDGDIVRNLIKGKKVIRNHFWACYHTELYNFIHKGTEIGILGCAVGSSFAVLVAEELFASGCKLVISFTSSGQIVSLRRPPYFVLIDKALRDEGTSYHYISPTKYSHLDKGLRDMLSGVFEQSGIPMLRGASWTTDAPFRETKKAIEYCKTEGILAVEMEAAALYAFAQAKRKPVICFAHITNQMGNKGDFEKGNAEGSKDALKIVHVVAQAWKKRNKYR